MRVYLLDLYRTLSIICMVIFHTAYDLRIFGLNSLDFSKGFWYAFPRVIAFSFLYCVGVSLFLTHQKGVQWHQLKSRSFKLGVSSLGISVITYYLFPTHWIYFGTLHCILLGSLLGAPLVNKKGLTLSLFALILIGQYGLGFDIAWISSLVQKPSMDFIPIYPWFWVILLGILTAPFLIKVSKKIKTAPPAWIVHSSKNSLFIYLAHQPLIYGLIWLIKTIS